MLLFLFILHVRAVTSTYVCVCMCVCVYDGNLSLAVLFIISRRYSYR